MIKVTENLTFHLQTEETSYIFRILSSGHASQLYYGRKIRHREDFSSLHQVFLADQSDEVKYTQDGERLYLNTIPMEAPTTGKGDFNEPLVHLKYSNGSRATDLTYDSHEIIKGKPALPEMPCFFASPEEAETLIINLSDDVTSVTVRLVYSLILKKNIILRHTEIENRGEEAVMVEKAMSFNLDFAQSDFDLITLEGHWIREKNIQRQRLTKGIFSIDSKKLTSGSHLNPFMALVEPNTTETNGNCYGFSLVYSGNHLCLADVSPYSLCRIQMGINPFDFSWSLKQGECFTTPEAVLTFSHEGLNGMSRNFHRGINENLIPKKWQKRERPLLFNSWEAMYFKFDQPKLIKLAKAGKELGMELFVLDDGWFKGRNDDTTSLGDWVADKKKLPQGLKGIGDKVRGLGLDFGIWVEPEMVSPDSDLYRAHPDWAIKLPNRAPSLGRNQLILDMSNPDVVDYLFDSLDAVFTESGVNYVKWDMNRSVTDLYSAFLGEDKQGEQTHRHYLGLYSLLNRLTSAHSEILFESCASGGNRYDLGMLAYMPQTWASDNTDPGSRMHIQYGSSLLYPQSTLGAHVGSNPSHQALRSNEIESRFNVAAFGALGYELNLTTLSNYEKKVIKKQVEFYKEFRTLFQFGETQRIISPFDSNNAVWMTVAEDKSAAMLGYNQKIQYPNGGFETIKLLGLNPDKLYEISTRQQYMNIERFGMLINDFVPFDIKTNGVSGLVHKTVCDNYLYPCEVQKVTAYGDELMNAGFKLNPQFNGADFNENVRYIGDFGSRIYHIKEVNS